MKQDVQGAFGFGAMAMLVGKMLGASDLVAFVVFAVVAAVFFMVFRAGIVR